MEQKRHRAALNPPRRSATGPFRLFNGKAMLSRCLGTPLSLSPTPVVTSAMANQYHRHTVVSVRSQDKGTTPPRRQRQLQPHTPSYNHNKCQANMQRCKTRDNQTAGPISRPDLKQLPPRPARPQSFQQKFRRHRGRPDDAIARCGTALHRRSDVFSGLLRNATQCNGRGNRTERNGRKRPKSSLKPRHVQTPEGVKNTKKAINSCREAI